MSLDKIQIDGAVETLWCGSDRAGRSTQSVHIKYDPAMWRLSGRYAQVRDAWNERNPNQRNDQKVAVRGIRLNVDGALECELQATEWSEVRPLHEDCALIENAALKRTNHGCDFLLPNIGVVHVIARTSDNFILAFRRSQFSHYHPGCWSATYEEGLAVEDLVDEHVFQRAARRGLAEEISANLHDLPLTSFSLVSFIVERSIGNPAAIVLAELPVLSSAIPNQRPSDELDAESSMAIPAELGILSRLIESTDFTFNKYAGHWHPTSRYRLLLAIARYFGDDAAAEALTGIRAR
jgi:hypothetical protein